eukprot:CAMPEP_0116555830 /NCGR_PEP_ID=MMETSP0397-20121206/8362_1 /TAXON_ID=216820 /ORGANISM="Cyclophora tenuis, Strain ECT3854" /LENGTH=347 /DNA_ID=CAMNT_0004081139 /DNA_START=204 /DNA_END=1247 /DNA_ORIENTATION=+
MADQKSTPRLHGRTVATYSRLLHGLFRTFFASGGAMNKVQVQARDVLWPFLLLTLTNVIVLTAWTILSPLRWVRYEEKDPRTVDPYGRSTESFGHCAGSNSIYWMVLGAFNFMTVVFANYQSYVARNIPTDFNESLYVAISMASLLECFLIGAPLLFLVDKGNPAAAFIVQAVLIAFGCASLLLPIYLHKFRAQSFSELDLASSIARGWRSGHLSLSERDSSHRRSTTRRLSVSLHELLHTTATPMGSTDEATARMMTPPPIQEIQLDTVARIRESIKRKNSMESESSGRVGAREFRPNRGLRASIPSNLQTISTTAPSVYGYASRPSSMTMTTSKMPRSKRRSSIG